jgi:hypothetical protein
MLIVKLRCQICCYEITSFTLPLQLIVHFVAFNLKKTGGMQG